MSQFVFINLNSLIESTAYARLASAQLDFLGKLFKLYTEELASSENPVMELNFNRKSGEIDLMQLLLRIHRTITKDEA